MYEELPTDAKNPFKKEFGCRVGCYSQKSPSKAAELSKVWTSCLSECQKDDNAYKPEQSGYAANRDVQGNDTNTDSLEATSDVGKYAATNFYFSQRLKILRTEQPSRISEMLKNLRKKKIIKLVV